jgi:hypothetical protein
MKNSINTYHTTPPSIGIQTVFCYAWFLCPERIGLFVEFNEAIVLLILKQFIIMKH